MEMADTTNISWTDATWNIITGCTLVDEGCRNCYAAHLAANWPALARHPSRAGLARNNADGVAKFTGEVRFNEQWLDQPLRWRKPRRIFVCAHGDLFHESVPDDWIDRVFAVMALCPQHSFQVLTKRPERMRAYLKAEYRRALIGEQMRRVAQIEASESVMTLWPLPNVWLGTSISDQASAEARIPDLLRTPAAVRFVSAEPLLGPVRLDYIAFGGDDIFGVLNALSGIEGCLEHSERWPASAKLDWVICGGESGKNARPMHPGWARSLRDQCVAAGVPFHFKQWGEWTSAMQMTGTTGISSAPAKDGHFAHPHRRRVIGGSLDGQCFQGLPDYHDMIRVGTKHTGHLLDGVAWQQFPKQGSQT
jgi:protein gp37